MKKKYLFPLCFLCCLLFNIPARAATTIGDLAPILGDDATNAPFIISGLDLPTTYNGRTYFANTVSGQLTNGQLNVTIVPPGRFNISFTGRGTSLRINNPANTNTYDISQLITNVLVFVSQGISRQVLPGAGAHFVTNNAGLATETITIVTTGGSATNSYQSQAGNALVTVTTDSETFIQTITPVSQTNANMQQWGLIAPSAKQDHSANLDLWNAVVPSSYQPILGYTPATTNFATLSVPGLILPDGVTLVIDGTTKKLSSVATGTGDVVGPGSSTSGHIAIYSSGTGKALSDSGHTLSEYTLLSQVASGSQAGVLSSSDWTAFNAKPTTNTALLTNDTRNVTLGGAITNKGPVLLPTPMPADTNAAANYTNVQAMINDQLAPTTAWADTGKTNAMLVNENGEPVKGKFGDNVILDAQGNFHTTVTGGSIAGMVTSNILIQTTNQIIWDLSVVQHLILRFNTNLNNLKLTNIWYLTNRDCRLDKWEDTNGTWTILSTNVALGLFRKMNGVWFGTNASQYDSGVVSLDGTGTNAMIAIDTNATPGISFTNTLTAGGGGGGGGAFTFVNAGGQTGTTGDTAVTVDTTGSTVGIACITYSSGSTPTVSSTLNASGWVLATNSGHIAIYYKITSYVAGNDTLTVGTVGGCSVVYLGYSKTSPAFDKFSTEGSTGNWNAPLAAGASTPSTASDLFVSVGRYDVASGTPTVDSSFNSRFTGFNGTSQNGIMVADKIKSGSSSAEAPAWTPGVSSGAGCYTLTISLQ